MGAAIGEVLGLAAGVAVSPLPIVAMILLLGTPRGRADGIMFGAGWLKLLLGVLALLLAARQWRGRPAEGRNRRCPGGWRAWTGCDPAGRSASGPCCRRSTPRTAA
jgi:hypothetical protein